jgi:hypothetical protein
MNWKKVQEADDKLSNKHADLGEAQADLKQAFSILIKINGVSEADQQIIDMKAHKKAEKAAAKAAKKLMKAAFAYAEKAEKIFELIG